MNRKQAPGRVIVYMTCAIMTITFGIVLLGNGDNPSNQDLMVALCIISAGQTAIIGYCAVLLWDKLAMLTHLYEILTGDKQEEMAGTLQRFRNTVKQGASKLRWGLNTPSNDPTLRQENKIDE